MSLDTWQSMAAHHPSRNLGIVAPAGSGKTAVLVERIEHLIRERLVDPERIVAITFTRRAGQVLVSRLAAKGLKIGYAGTAHSYCARLLMALSPRPLIVDDDDLESIWNMASGVPDRMTERDRRAVLECIQTPDDKESAPVRLTAAYCRAHTVLPIDMVVPMVAELKLAEGRADAALWDEYQDASWSDAQLLESFGACARTVVGDHHQAIYGFRGGCPVYLIGVPDKAALRNSYRCPDTILDRAERLWPAPRDVRGNGKPGTFAAVDVGEKWNNRAIAAALEGHFGGLGATVLCRTNYDCRSLKDALGEGTVLGRQQPTREERLVLDWCRVAIRPCDWVLWRLGIGGGERFDPLTDGSLVQWLAAKGIKNKADEALNAGAFESVETLCAWLGIKPVVNAELTPAEWVHWYLRRDVADMIERPEVDTCKWLVMTAHASKGLEWPRVAVVGLGQHWPSPKGDPEEGRCLAYVAMTRAQEHLLLVGSAKHPAIGG
jgi:hypothetical protein